MKIFWSNIVRYSRFLVTSVLGLIVLVFGNFLNLKKLHKEKQLIFIIGIISLLNLLNILFNLLFNL